MVLLQPEECETVELGGLEILVISGKNDLEVDKDWINEIIRDGGPMNVEIYSTAGKQFEYTKECDFRICQYGPCWGPGVPCISNCQGECTELIDAPNDKVAIVGTDARLPEDWEKKFERDEKLTVKFDEEFPSEFCQGDFESVSFSLSSNFICEEPSATVTITNNLSGESETEDVTVSNSFDESFFFSLNIPDDVEAGADLDVLTIDIETDVPVSPESTITESATVGNPGGILSVTDINSDSTNCPGDDFRASVEVSNSGGCRQNASVNLVNNLNDEVIESDSNSLFSGSSRSFRFNPTLPEEAATVDQVTYTAQVIRAGNVATSSEFTVSPELVDFSLSNIDSPEQICTGTDFGIDVEARNTGECRATARVVAVNQSTGEEEIVGSETINSRRTFTSVLKTSLSPDVSDQDTAVIDFTVESRAGDEWIEQDTAQSEIEVLTSELSLAEDIYPDEVNPGTIDVPVKIENNGDCFTTGTITGPELNEDFEVNPGSSTTVNHQIDVLSSPVDITIEVTDDSTGEVIEASETIFPRRFVSISTSEGIVKMVGSFEEPVTYRGSMTGSGISGENLEDKDRVMSGFVNAVYRGEMSTDVTDSDIINFDSLTSLNQQVDEEVTWIVDGSIEGVADSFKYETVTSSTISQLRVDGQDTELEVTAGPIANVGVARRRFDIGDRIVKSPFLRF